MPEAPDLHLDQVTKRFGAKVAVDRISLSLPTGKFLVLLGPSGSGKSTLLRCLAGIDVPSSGTITFGETVVDAPGFHLPPGRCGLAMVFQDYALWPHLTAQANVAFALERTGAATDARGRQAVEVLDKVGLPGLAGRYPGQLSGGEQQRVALLFDEPLSNLDAGRPLGGWTPAPGQPVRVLVRPRALHLGPEGSGIAASVRDVAFREWGYEHVIELPGGQTLTGVAADHRLPFGRSVNVEFAPTAASSPPPIHPGPADTADLRPASRKGP